MIHIVDDINNGCMALYVDKKFVAVGESYNDLFGQIRREELLPYMEDIAYNENALDHGDDWSGFPENFNDLNLGASHAA